MTHTISIQGNSYFSAICMLFECYYATHNKFMRHNKNDVEKISKFLYFLKVTSSVLLFNI